MTQRDQGPSGTAGFRSRPGSRRSLPRVSHACQRCRAKKAKCDQQHPCRNCVKHSIDCEYGVRRRGGRRKKQALRDNTQRLSPCAPPFVARSPNTAEGIELLEQPQGTSRSGFAPQTVSANDLEVVGDINQRTQGTEFYGTSSNFVLLHQLFAFAREHNPSWYVSSNSNETAPHLFPASTSGNDDFITPDGNNFTAGDQGVRPGLTALPQDRVSIINLLSNEEMLLPPSQPKTPPPVRQTEPYNFHQVPNGVPRSAQGENPTEDSPTASNEEIVDVVTPSRTSTTRSHQQAFTVSSARASKTRLEQAYVQVFMHNLHHLHPMLDPVAFGEKCERHVWAANATDDGKKGLRHFFALYNIVVAIGALIAGGEVFTELERDVQLCTAHLADAAHFERVNSSQAVSRIYFQRSKDLLGDTSAVCSLQSAQTLLLMSLYCQNSHMPHRCYMYCGQAVRTALAIGLANETTSMPAEDQKAARRTWWCIYSHEIDMSCSSGRRDSLRKPQNYQTPLPLIRDHSTGVSDAIKSEDRKIAMINEMVHFAAILRRISKELYHDPKGLTLLQKSVVARELDHLLGDWKDKLPEWLDFNKPSFREHEWAGKQKLVLQLRYLNARILAHRLFLIPRKHDSQIDMSGHVNQCLDAARETIQVLHVAYAHRHYFRTWWYNSTYTLYAGMIVLYVVMLRATDLCSENLLSDVVKAQDILQSMQEASVALRGAELLREGLEIARSCSQRDVALSIPPDGLHTNQANDGSRTQLHAHESNPSTDNDVSQTAFAVSGYEADAGSLFASLIDPGLLQDFTIGLNALADLDTSPYLFDNPYGSWLGETAISIP